MGIVEKIKILEEFMDKCETHSTEIVEIRTEFNSFRDNISKQLEEIKEQLKPQFTSAQLTALLLTAIGYMVGIMLYVNGMKSDTRDNSTRLEHIEQSNINNAIQYENIDLKLEKLLTDVAVLKATEK